MLSTVYRKQLSVLLGVLLLGFVLLALVLNLVLRDFLVDRKSELLFREGDHLLEILKEPVSSGDTADGTSGTGTISSVSPANRSAFVRAEAQLKRTENIRVDLLQADESTNSAKWRKQALKLLRQADIQDPKLLKKVLSGQRIIHRGLLTTSDDHLMLTAGLPLLEDGRVAGALFLSTPVEEIQTSRVTRLIFLTALMTALPASLLILWMSRRLTGPVRRMTQGARRLGQGDFTVRIPVEGRDEISQLAATFNTMAGQLEKLDRMRTELVTNVSHELRTPLTSVRGFVQGLVEGVIPEDQRPRYLQVIHSELSRLTTLLNTMLDLSAVETGTVTLERKSIRWMPLVETVMETVAPRFEQKEIRYDILGPEREVLRAFGDPERLKQVLFNLLDNAVRHTPEGGSVTVRSWREGDRLAFRVSDTGTGIPPDKLPHIWDRFFTEEPSRQSRSERSGLGLTITKQLVERMGGTITVESEPGMGTAFTVLMPLPPSPSE